MVRNMTTYNGNKKSFGSTGELIATSFLKNNGYTVLAQNFRFGRLGEIDIIARENEYICFIEVKTRSSTLFGMPCESVNRKKQENIIKLAQVYLKQHRLTNSNVRFDVVEVILNKSLKEINLIKNAF